jgi:hypothetical protein
MADSNASSIVDGSRAAPPSEIKPTSFNARILEIVYSSRETSHVKAALSATVVETDRKDACGTRRVQAGVLAVVSHFTNDRGDFASS